MNMNAKHAVARLNGGKASRRLPLRNAQNAMDLSIAWPAVGPVSSSKAGTLAGSDARENLVPWNRAAAPAAVAQNVVSGRRAEVIE
jgi:hypothetical protein